MFNYQGLRKFSLAVAAAAFFALAGCSNQATDQAKNQAPAPTKKAAAAKPAAGKPAAAKPAAKKAEAGQVVAARGATAKPAAVNKAPQTATVTVPKGTAISATVGQTLATDKNKVGDTFAASLATPVQLDGKVVIPKGAQITGRIVTVKKHELKVTLASVIVHGKSYPLETNSVAGPKSPAQNKATEKDAKSTDKASKDVTLLAAKSQVTFKLAKPVTIPVKAAATPVKG